MQAMTRRAVHGKLPLVDIFYTSAAFKAEEHPKQQAKST
jgi:hypothetical protein